MNKPELRLAFCSHAAAKYACEKWHYSKSMSSAKNVYIGVWEDKKYIGCVIFGIGSGNATNGKSYGLERIGQMAELTRIALCKHITPVSKIMSIAIRTIKQQSPKLRLLISMADPRHGHHGGIYQANNWIYTGDTKPDVEYFDKGQWRHHRTATSRRSAVGLKSRKLPGKHRYLYPLDADIRAQIEPLRKPYPKKCAGSIASDALVIQTGEGGSTPTPALQ